MKSFTVFNKLCLQIGILLLAVSCSDAVKESEKKASESDNTEVQQEAKTEQQENKVSLSDQTGQIKQKLDGKLEVVKSEAKDLTGGNCAKLAQADCLTSRQCVLDQDKTKRYFCRKAKDACEVGFVQTGDNEESSCTDKKVCQFKAASCYCPPNVECVCGGGKPSSCNSKLKLDF